MSSRSWVVITAVMASLLGIVFAADALFTTPEEQLEAMVDGFEGVIDDARLESALRHIDLSREPLELRAGGLREHYEAGDTAALAERAEEALQPLRGAQLTIIQRSLEVGETQARVAVRARTSAAEVVNLTLLFAKHGDRWLVRSLRLS